MSAFRGSTAFRALALVAMLGGASRFSLSPLLPSACPEPASTAMTSCCASSAAAVAMPQTCPPEAPMPCCRLTRPAPAAPGLLTAASLSVPVLEAPRDDRPAPSAALLVAPPRAVTVRGRSSPLFIVHSTFLI
ncbi:MAG: hypothetical protein ABIT01_10615 [Thermoanaerobaculia bacterium]